MNPTSERRSLHVDDSFHGEEEAASQAMKFSQLSLALDKINASLRDPLVAPSNENEIHLCLDRIQQAMNDIRGNVLCLAALLTDNRNSEDVDVRSRPAFLTLRNLMEPSRDENGISQTIQQTTCHDNRGPLKTLQQPTLSAGAAVPAPAIQSKDSCTASPASRGAQIQDQVPPVQSLCTPLPLSSSSLPCWSNLSDPISQMEFDKMPRSLKGRWMTLQVVNDALFDIQKLFHRHQQLTPRRGEEPPRLRGRQHSSASPCYGNGVFVLEEQELRKGCAFFRQGEGTARATLIILRMLGRLEQRTGYHGGGFYYALPTTRV